MFERTSRGGRIEEIILYALLVAIGAMPVSGVVVDHEPFGAEATIGLILLALGAIGLLATAVRTLHHQE
jgi:hypothetical protein